MYMYAILSITQMVKINSQVKDIKCSHESLHLECGKKKNKYIITHLSHMLQDE